MRFDPLPFTACIDTTAPDATPFTWTPKVVSADEPPFVASVPDGAVQYLGTPEDSGPGALPSDPFVFSHAGLVFTAPVPLKLNHEPRVIGEITGVFGDGPRLMARGLVYRDTPWRDCFICETSAAGFPWRMSTGVRLARMSMRRIPAGEPVTVNNRDLIGPLLVVDRFAINEVSVGLDAVDRATYFNVEPGADYAPRREELSRILEMPTGAGATFTDDLFRNWTVALDHEGAELLGCAAQVSAHALASDRAYRAAVLKDRNTLTNVLYCMSFDATGRRAGISLEDFRAGLQTDWTIVDASGALLDALACYVGRPARRAALTV